MARKDRSDDPLWGLLDAITDRRERVEQEEARRVPELTDEDYE